ncbi:hypothetical protein RI845_12555 [Thalassotalea nanhaiensis]|uniref:Outer membrane protein OmpA-like transmembrane domain-containing protein n=1 Tax=Thalassotalea nanhaiensis TaxID=3065648 RepID=A0ABY9TF06_9GAMM|nr:hypothetical protein RI845_12555 [Colwelliaceae bacterium SQ345]
MISKYLPTFILLSLFSSTVNADFYIGAGLGRTEFEREGETATQTFNYDDNKLSGSLFVGYHNKSYPEWMRFEGGLKYHGSWDVSKHDHNFNDELSSVTLTWVPTFISTSQLNLVGKIGSFWWNSNHSGLTKFSDLQGGSGQKMYAGIALEVIVTKSLGFRIGAEEFDLDYVKMQSVELEVHYTF